ncbi:MAG: hypothetical protein Q8R13_05360 [bacterium]|nr:hypothetical protein [bacterium]MDZ4296500.1 hypothetical protein [Patescibacteria group bacterium]
MPTNLFQHFKTLPRELRAAIFSEESAALLYRITMEEAGLLSDQAQTIAKLSGRVLMGLVRPEELAGKIQAEAGVDPAEAQKIALVIRTSIIKPVEKHIEALWAGKAQAQTVPSVSPLQPPPRPPAPAPRSSVPSPVSPPTAARLDQRPAPATLPQPVSRPSAPFAPPPARPVAPPAPQLQSQPIPPPRQQPPQNLPMSPTAPPPPAAPPPAPESAQDFDDDWKSKMLAAEPDPFMPHKPKPVPKLDGNVVDLKQKL